MSFANKVVLVTGASSGIGAATAEAFSSEKAHVVLVARNVSKLAAVAARCNDPLVLPADVTNDEDLRRVVDRTIERFGQIDILINNAGKSVLAKILSGNIIECYDTLMALHVRSPVVLTSLVAPHLIKTKGNIINISSVAGQISNARCSMTMYCVSKSALNHFSLCAAEELAEYGVRVNTVSPGPVVTDLLMNCNIPGSWDNFKRATVLDRVSDPSEIAVLVLFIASDKGKSITGCNYVIDNGTLLKRYK